MSHIIYPWSFEGQDPKCKPIAFFTGRDPGLDISEITEMPVYFPIQEHTGHIHVLKDVTEEPEVADAVVTNLKGIMLGLKVADCVPVLIYDPVTPAIGAVHAGWRGTAKEILKSTTKTMGNAYGSRPEDMLVAIGPSIRWCCYEVGREVLDAVARASGPGDYTTERDGKLCLDLQSANKHQALSVKIQETNISIIEECTYCYPEKYFSYRHAKGPTGRQGGFIGMT